MIEKTNKLYYTLMIWKNNVHYTIYVQVQHYSATQIPYS